MPSDEAGRSRCRRQSATCMCMPGVCRRGRSGHTVRVIAGSSGAPRMIRRVGAKACPGKRVGDERACVVAGLHVQPAVHFSLWPGTSLTQTSADAWDPPGMR